MTVDQLLHTIKRDKLPKWYRHNMASPVITVLLGDKEYHELERSLYQHSYQSLFEFNGNNNPSAGKFDLYDWVVIHVAMRSYQDIILSPTGINHDKARIS